MPDVVNIVIGARDMTQTKSQCATALLSTLLSLLIYIYCIVGFVFAAPYFNWKYATENGFASWLFCGEIVATSKALIWPYYAITGSVSFAPLFWLALVIAILTASGFTLNCLARWVSTKGSVLRNAFAFVLACGSSYAALFLLNMWMQASNLGVPPANAIAATFTWIVIAIIFGRAAFKTAGSVITISVPFFLSALINAIDIIAPSLPEGASRGWYLVTAIALCGLGVIIIAGKKSTTERSNILQAYA
jgi:hypothetical protein